MTTAKGDGAETKIEIVQDSNEALADESGDQTSDDRLGIRRRLLLKTLGAGAALSVGSGVVSADDDRDGAGSDGNKNGADALLEDLTTVLSTTHKYHEIGKAIEDGYEEFGVMPPVGHIYQKSDHYEGAEFTGPTELTEPPALLFYAPIASTRNDDDFDLVLAGVEYHVCGDQTSNPPDLFADEDTSYEVKVPEAEGWHRSPVPDILDVTGLHVWLYLSNPAGIFHGGHPLLEHLVDQ